MAVHFKPYRTQGGLTGGETRDFIIANSQTISLGEMVRLASGFINTAGASSRILGACVGLVRDIGGGQTVPLDQDAAGSVTGTRSGNAGVLGSETYAAASDNQTVDKVMARVLTDPNMEYHNDASADLAVSDLGQYYNLVAGSNQIDQATETTFAETAATSQMILLEVDPDNDADLSKGIFKIVKSALQG